jgi:CDP-diacylglycerol--serine O-phosphatidyltransferase
MTWRQLLPTLITLAAMLCGLFSIFRAFEGHFLMSAQFIMLAMILDGLDGNLARLLKGTSAFGAELDTYVDMTAFGLAPAILIYHVTLQRFVDWKIFMTALVVLSGVIRLARFKVRDPMRGQAGYCGLPITASAGWVALFVFLSEQPHFSDFFRLSQGPVGVFFLLGVVVMLALQVSNVRYPKPSKRILVFIPCMVLVGLLFYPHNGVASVAALVMLVLGIIYIVGGPFFVNARKEAPPAAPAEPEAVEEATL